MGLFITLEGGEGAGKTTQGQRLTAWLEAHSTRPVLYTREPGGTPLGRTLREILLHAPLQPMATTELLLYAADRAEHVARVIRPALADDGIVVCDRFIDSTVAYQGYGRGLDLALIAQLNRIATGGLLPDLTLWFRLDPERGLARRDDHDRLEAAGLAFHRRVHDGFAALATEHPTRIRTVAADADVETIAAQVREIVSSYLK